MDLDWLKDPKIHLYPSRRGISKALGIPESTVRAQVRKIKHKIPIRSKAMGMTGKRLLTNSKEIILVNVILDAQELGVCIT